MYSTNPARVLGGQKIETRKLSGKLSHRVLGADCNTFDVVVGVIDRVDERVSFVHFVGMLVGSCFNFGNNGKYSRAKNL